MTFLPEVVAANPALAGVEILVPAGALFDDNGSRGGRVGIAPVPPDRLPEPLPEGLNFPLVITIQTDGPRNFAQPVPVRFPNLADPVTGVRLPPGAKTALWSFDHDKGYWEIVGPATGQFYSWRKNLETGSEVRGRRGRGPALFPQPRQLAADTTYRIDIVTDDGRFGGTFDFTTGESGSRLALGEIVLRPLTGPDTDGDGLTDFGEDVLGSDRNRADTDGDGVSDRAETEAGTPVNGATDEPLGMVAGASTPGYAWDIIVVGDLAAVGESRGVSVFNVLNPAIPALVGRLDLPGQPRTVAGAGRGLATSDPNSTEDGAHDVQVFDAGPDEQLGTGDDVGMAGAFSMAPGTAVAQLEFSPALPPGRYRAKVDRNVSDAAGNTLAADVVWDFTVIHLNVGAGAVSPGGTLRGAFAADEYLLLVSGNNPVAISNPNRLEISLFAPDGTAPQEFAGRGSLSLADEDLFELTAEPGASYFIEALGTGFPCPHRWSVFDPAAGVPGGRRVIELDLDADQVVEFAFFSGGEGCGEGLTFHFLAPDGSAVRC